MSSAFLLFVIFIAFIAVMSIGMDHAKKFAITFSRIDHTFQMPPMWKRALRCAAESVVREMHAAGNFHNASFSFRENCSPTRGIHINNFSFQSSRIFGNERLCHVLLRIDADDFREKSGIYSVLTWSLVMWRCSMVYDKLYPSDS